ncbi:MAG: carbohydrate binding family 9 domain-containing protein [Acidobacteria bacterium]|nr:carbohydrate binding family 9 domain-containing protein [Acidobacteriota bacterium]
MLIESHDWRRFFILISITLTLDWPLAAGQGKREILSNGREQKVLVAIRTTTPITLDGTLDELGWQRAGPATGFIQQNPHDGQPPTEPTEARVLYDDRNLYFGIYAYDSEPDKIVVHSLEKDYSVPDEDGVCIYLDTFDDDRNGQSFCFSPVGAKNDRQFVNEGKDVNNAWDEVWDVKTTINQEGWFAEVMIPFKSLRFPKSETQTWGINIQRRIRRRNEQSFWSPIPRRYPATAVSLAGSLQGIEGIRPRRNFRFKPFVTAQSSKIVPDDLDSTADAGFDLKYGLTSSFTLDATVNTDFSQIEVDEQQVNLTRFSLFFPEKRDFFLENAGIFVFGQTDQGGGAVGGPRGRAEEREIIPFFSRRIGLSSLGGPIPILAGIRLTGRPGRHSIGFLNMQTREAGSEPANNFTVLRVKRDILAYSEVGALLINRQADHPGDYNRMVGMDGNFRFWENLRINSFFASTYSPHLEGRETAGRLWAEWRTDFLEARSGYLDIGKNFNAEVGFVPRRDIRKSDSSFGLRPRPRRNRWIREFFPNVRLQYIMDHENRLLTRISNWEFQTEFQDGAVFTIGRAVNFERLDQPFAIRRAISIAPRDYHFDAWVIEASSNPGRKLSGGLRHENGDFWDGERSAWQFSVAFKPHYKFAVTARYSRDEVRLQSGVFTANLFNMRLNYSFSTKMFLNALIQYNNDLRKVSSNVRFHVIHHPLSDLFVVYNEQRDAFQGGVIDKSLSLKYTHMLDLF